MRWADCWGGRLGAGFCNAPAKSREWAPGLPSEMQSRPGPASGGGGGSLCRTDGELLWETFQPRAARSPGFKGLLTAARAYSPLPGRQSGLQGVAGREPEKMTRGG